MYACTAFVANKLLHNNTTQTKIATTENVQNYKVNTRERYFSDRQWQYNLPRFPLCSLNQIQALFIFKDFEVLYL